MHLIFRPSMPAKVSAMLALACLVVGAAHAQEPAPRPPLAPGEVMVGPGQDRQKPPAFQGADKVSIDYPDKSLYELTTWIADITRRNFILSDPKELQNKKVTIISHTMVTPAAAYEAFLSALEISGFSLVEVGGVSRIVKSQEAGQGPIAVGIGDSIPASDRYVTQLLQMENVSVTEISKVIQGMLSPNAKIIAYAPSNTLIITETANNIRKVYRVMKELDIAAPKSTLEITAIRYATAEDIKAMVEELYGTVEVEAAPDPRAPARARLAARRAAQQPQESESVTAGSESKYISKVIADERTNSIIVLANAEGHEAVRTLIAQVDIDVDPQNRAQIHVVYLENAKADDVEQVLSSLSQGSGNQQQQRPQGAAAARAAVRNPAAQVDESAARGAIAAFDSGMRIAADENTNSLVIIANQEDFRVINSVIKQLDIVRRQVFVDAVILELSSRDSLDLGLALHGPVPVGRDSVGIVGGQFGASSLALTQDLLSGLAVGVFGPTVDVPFSVGGITTSVPIPAFGIVLNAIKTNSSTNIISNPTLTMVDNEEARIVVGRKVPFPTTNSMSQFGQQMVSFQREDVAVTLEVTPRINSANMVTLVLRVEAQEIEQDNQGLNVNQAGFITSKREVETTVVVGDNETVVLGGLVGNTDTVVESKTPILGDLPVIGALFRGRNTTSVKSNLMIFLTPHIIDGPEDKLEIQRVKEAQRSEFLRRFYGKSREQQMREMQDLLQYSLNYVDRPSVYRGPSAIEQEDIRDARPLSDETRRALEDALPGPNPAPEPPAPLEED